jgi:hypothetical protein
MIDLGKRRLSPVFLVLVLSAALAVGAAYARGRDVDGRGATA